MIGETSVIGKDWLDDLNGHITIYTCVHGELHEELRDLIDAIHAQTGKWPAVYRTPGGAFALHPLSYDDEIRNLMSRRDLKRHKRGVKSELQKLETVLADTTTGVLVISHTPGCLEIQHRLGEVHPEVEEQMNQRILPDVGPRVAKKAADMGRPVPVWTMLVHLDDSRVIGDPFAELTLY